MNMLYLWVSLLGVILTVTSIESICHKYQLYYCLQVCGAEVTPCIAIGNRKCLNTYHTCIEKAKDAYKCFLSSRIP